MPADYPYRPALISTTNDPGHRELVVFPIRGKSFEIPIRFAAASIFSPDGRALYGACTPYRAQEKAGDPIKIAVCKVDLYTGITTPVPGMVHDFARYGTDRVPKDRGHMLGLTLPDAKPVIISLPVDAYPWMYLSLSPDRERAAATHNGRVELIDIVHETTKPLEGEFFIAAWSPDGKWLAAVENGEEGRTILMDAATLTRRRVLGNSELVWSPDSRYLLGMKQHDKCGPDYGTLEAIEIETGKRTTIESSKCQINQAMTGWVSSDISAK